MLLRTLLSAIAFIGLSAIIWLIGPLLAIADSKPLSTSWGRLLLIVVVFLLVFTPLVFTWIRNRQAETALKKGLTHRDEKAKVQSAKLESIFAQAVTTLKTHQKRQSIFEAKQGLYELPWYVFIGPPGSGKTTALKNAGLRFPLKEQLGQDAMKGMGGTRNCDWWFTDQAVMIDTAGRFTTQDSDHDTDSAAWRSFLKLLSKYRPQQPINGVLLTLSVEDLLTSDAKRDELATTLGLRLQEMVKTLGVCPPVYVLLTKMDLISGFQESFQRLNETERAQGWGINFDYPNQATQAIAEHLPLEIDSLAQRLDEQRPTRLSQETRESARTAILGFPQEFAHLNKPLCQVLKRAFEDNRLFEKPILLRGVYFTSGTQDGSALDRIMIGLNKIQNTPAQPALAAKQGKSFFIRDVLQDVVFAEKHLVGYVKKKALLKKWLQIGVCSISVLITAGFTAGWAISNQNNSERLNRLDAKTAALREVTQALSFEPHASLTPLFAALTALSDLTKPESTPPYPLSTKFGLNQEDKLLQAEHIAYEQALKDSLMPRLAIRLEERLDSILKSPTSDIELTYEALKAYLMLYDTKHFNAQALTQWVELDWNTFMLRQLTPEQREQALQHLRNAIALGLPDTIPEKNTELVNKARQTIGVSEQESRVYNRIKRFYRVGTVSDFNLITKAGTNAANVFDRQSGKSLNEGVSGLFTKKGYYTYFLPALLPEAQRLAQESEWVLNQPSPTNPIALKENTDKIRQLYIQEYIHTWRDYIADVSVKKAKDFDQTVELTRLLASSQSPLKKFLKAVSDETQLAGQSAKLLSKAQDQATTRATQRAASQLPSQLQILMGDSDNGSTTDAPLEQQVDDYFAATNSLFTGTPPAYDQVSTLLNDLYTQLSAVQAAQKSQGTPPSPNAISGIGVSASLLPEPVKSMVSQITASGSAQSQAAQRANLSADLQPLQEVCQRTVANRYPMSTNSTSDVLPEDFARFFGNNGMMSQFFDARLRELVDTGGPQWRYKALADGRRPAQTEALEQFQRAARIRDVFFAGNQPNAGFSVEMKLLQSSVPSDVFYMETDGNLKMFSAQFEPKHTISWQGASPSSQIQIRSSNDTQPKIFNGPWALFRLFDFSRIEPTDRPERLKARITLNNKWFDFEILAKSAFNPLRLNELRSFRCPSAL